jgi:alpha,alpha-trehalase
MAGVAPVELQDGYLPVADHGLIGDGSTAALVGRDGSVSWLCVPYFDSDTLFCGLLDRKKGGSFLLAPDKLVASKQTYVPDTGILVTELHGPQGTVEVTDALALRAGADLSEQREAGCGKLVRSARVTQGRVGLRVAITPRGGADGSGRDGWLDLRWPRNPDLDLRLESDRRLGGLDTTHDMSAGDRLQLTLSWGRPGLVGSERPDRVLRETADAWRRWLGCFTYEGPQEEAVRRSTITLKLLDHFANGAILAAPTSSLPERVGGERNWDYRYAWIRDASFSVYALRRIGMHAEGDAFLAWVLRAVEKKGHPRVLYNLEGEIPPPERTDVELEGYRSSSPVRWGNAAAEQRQHDVYGEIVDCAYQWMRAGGRVESGLWGRLGELVDAAGHEWDTPDHGIWEVRSSGRIFTYSAALCQVALDRATLMAEALGLPSGGTWAKKASRVAKAVVDNAWNEERQSLTEHLDGSGGLDASLLALPLRRVLPADHPRMVATTKAIQRNLAAGGGLLYRYDPDTSPDGLSGHEGALLLCSFWLVDNLAGQGRLEEAFEVFDSLCGRANQVGLLPEEIDPSSGMFLGNFPQAFSHVGVVSSAVNLSRYSPSDG